jgi:phosphoserine phosphatase
MAECKEIILLKVSDMIRPGVTAFNNSIGYVQCYCVGHRADIHETLSLGILFEIEAGSCSAPVLKDLLFKGYELGLRSDLFHFIIDYESWVHNKTTVYH